MNKSEFISAVAEKSGLSKVDAKKAVEAFVDTVSNELKEGGKVALLGFGSFSKFTYFREDFGHFSISSSY